MTDFDDLDLDALSDEPRLGDLIASLQEVERFQDAARILLDSGVPRGKLADVCVFIRDDVPLFCRVDLIPARVAAGLEIMDRDAEGDRQTITKEE